MIWARRGDACVEAARGRGVQLRFILGFEEGGSRLNEGDLVVDGGADIDRWAELSDAVSNGDFATALVDAVATYASLDSVDASNAVQVTASLEALEAIRSGPDARSCINEGARRVATPAPVASTSTIGSSWREVLEIVEAAPTRPAALYKSFWGWSSRPSA